LLNPRWYVPVGTWWMFIGDPETGISDTSLPSCLPCAPTIGTDGAYAHYDHASIHSAYDSSSLVSCSILTHAATSNDSCNHDQLPESHFRCHDPAPPKRLPAPPSSSYATPSLPPRRHRRRASCQDSQSCPDSKANLRGPAPGAQSPPACVTKAPKWTRYTRRDLLQPGEARCRSAPRCRRRNLDANVGLGTQGKWCGSVKECKGTWVT
jgi:hypothetical protein